MLILAGLYLRAAGFTWLGLSISAMGTVVVLGMFFRAFTVKKEGTR